MELVVREGCMRRNSLKSLGMPLSIISEEDWEHSGDFELHSNAGSDPTRIMKDIEHMGFRIDNSKFNLHKTNSFSSKSTRWPFKYTLKDIFMPDVIVYDIYAFVDVLN